MLANLGPTGADLMEDFFHAGGLRTLLAERTELIDPSQKAVNGRTLVENLEGSEIFNGEVIRRHDQPLLPNSGLAVLHGHIAMVP